MKIVCGENRQTLFVKLIRILTIRYLTKNQLL